MRSLIGMIGICFLAFSQAHATTLYAILVSTSALPGSGAGDISSGTNAGMALFRGMLEQVSRIAGFSTDIHEISGDKFVSVNVNREIEDLEPGTDDIVVFFYTGHGFHDPTTTDRFPSMYIPTTVNGVYGGIQETHVRSLLLAKHPRLLITVFDSCSSIRSGYIANPRFATAPQLPDTPETQASVKALFGQSGSITAAGTTVGTESFVALGQGGYFTLQLLNAIYNKVVSGTPSWDPIMSQATERIMLPGEEPQLPIYEKDLGQ